ncbi:MAG TPA: ferrous iron transport protein A [Bacteroidetes bacterium]|jgi:Fe2+ transport system protein FeoA|uniref:Ferrous iron transport protein A n=1 Tax=candidate division TA06 bacterium TaxID=2250710 RepID=A0A660SBS4_UNCT6|nr:MAG: ferrous iron transport protein A [candidate division TA06 bacterium]HHD82675.1 ferrous iron transport protein A [Bacteroidota bacterium]
MLKTLSEAEIGKEYRVIELRGGLNFQRRITAMGLYMGAIVKIVRKAPFRGPLLVDINSSVVAVGRNIALKIFVEEV